MDNDLSYRNNDPLWLAAGQELEDRKNGVIPPYELERREFWTRALNAMTDARVSGYTGSFSLSEIRSEVKGHNN